MAMVSQTEGSGKLWKQVRKFQATFENTEFSAEDQILIFYSLTRFIEESKTFGVCNAHAFQQCIICSVGKQNNICNLSAMSHDPTAWHAGTRLSIIVIAFMWHQRLSATPIMIYGLSFNGPRGMRPPTASESIIQHIDTVRFWQDQQENFLRKQASTKHPNGRCPISRIQATSRNITRGALSIFLSGDESHRACVTCICAPMNVKSKKNNLISFTLWNRINLRY